jgi:hypothetical protein
VLALRRAGRLASHPLLFAINSHSFPGDYLPGKTGRSRPFSKLSDYRAFIGSAKQNFDVWKQRQACARQRAWLLAENDIINMK